MCWKKDHLSCYVCCVCPPKILLVVTNGNSILVLADVTGIAVLHFGDECPVTHYLVLEILMFVFLPWPIDIPVSALPESGSGLPD